MSQSPPAPDAVTETILRSFIEALNAGDVAKAQSFGAEGATWWILGRPEKYPHLPIVGTHPFHQILESLPEFRRILDADPFTVTVKDIIVSREGGKAALELVPYGTSSTGKVYTHSVFMKATLDGHGKITEIREYLDFSHVEDLYSTS